MDAKWIGLCETNRIFQSGNSGILFSCAFSFEVYMQETLVLVFAPAFGADMKLFSGRN